MKEEYEQLELDTRKQLEKAMEVVATDAVKAAGELIDRHHRTVALERQIAPPFVRNRHEAYGIAAEQLARINGAIKGIKDDTGTLLGTLADPNFPAVGATSSIYNSTLEAAAIIIKAAAEMKRTMENLYTAESTGQEETPLDKLAATGAAFEEADPVEAEGADPEEADPAEDGGDND